MNIKTLVAALAVSFAAGVAGVFYHSYAIIAAGAAAALVSAVWYRNAKKKRMEQDERNEQQEIKERIKQVNFPVFMNNVKQKYGEIIFKYRLPQKPLTLEGMLYWCCDDYLVILPEWNYYQEIICKKYNESYLNESDEKKLFDDMCVIHKRDILHFEQSRDQNRYAYGVRRKVRRYERTIPVQNETKTRITYRLNGFITEKVLPEAAFDILRQLIPEKVKSVYFPGNNS